jgi:hypothetical protein
MDCNGYYKKKQLCVLLMLPKETFLGLQVFSFFFLQSRSIFVCVALGLNIYFPKVFQITWSLQHACLCVTISKLVWPWFSHILLVVCLCS